MRSHLKTYSLPGMGWKFPPFWNVWHYKWLLSLSYIGVIIWKEVSLTPAWTGKCYMTNIPYISTSWCVSFVIQSVPQFYFWPNWIKVEQVESSCVGFTLPTIVTWMIQNICKPVILSVCKTDCTRTCWNSLLRLPIWCEEPRLRVDMQLSQIKEDDYEMSLVPYFYPTKHRLLYQYTLYKLETE